jgi:hypothetical protein
MMEMRRLISEGYLGGRPIHLETGHAFGRLNVCWGLPGDAHWLHGLRTGVHNIINHGIAKLAEFLMTMFR